MFGVGAAKAGTSWLHHYLSRHPECHFRAIKELQYFNSFQRGPKALASQQARIEGMRDRVRSRLGDESLSSVQIARRAQNLVDIEQFLDLLNSGEEDRDGYLDYLHDGVSNARLVGDITPAYSLLDRDRLGSVARIGADVRFVYLLRDPIQRLWSHVRMIARRRMKTETEFERRAKNVFRRTLQGEEDHILERSDYKGALERLSAAIDPGKLCVETYENLFNGTALRRICDFLGLTFRDPDRRTFVNQGWSLDMMAEQRGQAAALLENQYEAVRSYLGFLPKGWGMEGAR